MISKIKHENVLEEELALAAKERFVRIRAMRGAGLTDKEIAWILVRIGKSYLLTPTGVNNIRNNG